MYANYGSRNARYFAYKVEIISRGLISRSDRRKRAIKTHRVRVCRVLKRAKSAYLRVWRTGWNCWKTSEDDYFQERTRGESVSTRTKWTFSYQSWTILPARNSLLFLLVFPNTDKTEDRQHITSAARSSAFSRENIQAFIKDVICGKALKPVSFITNKIKSVQLLPPHLQQPARILHCPLH